jgi:hypothetical protein
MQQPNLSICSAAIAAAITVTATSQGQRNEQRQPSRLMAGSPLSWTAASTMEVLFLPSLLPAAFRALRSCQMTVRDYASICQSRARSFSSAAIAHIFCCLSPMLRLLTTLAWVPPKNLMRRAAEFRALPWHFLGARLAASAQLLAPAYFLGCHFGVLLGPIEIG